MTGIAPFPYGITVTVQRQTGPANRYGEANYADDHEVSGCALAPRYSSEVNDNRTSTIIGYSLFGPANPDILRTDRIKTPDGTVHRVVGELADWHNPLTGWQPGFEVALERVA